MTHPQDNLILFDGVCNLCLSSVQFIIRHDKKAIFRFASLQSELGTQICLDHGFHSESVQTILLFSKGRLLTRSDAFLDIAAQIGGVWQLFTIFKIMPRPWRDAVYSFIARRRYRWFGRRDHCTMPSADDKKRFLE